MTQPMNSRVEEGRFVRVHGVDQWITIRGDDRRNPPILILPGPGAGMCVLAPFFATWEKTFSVVQWDQPRAGATHARHGGRTPGEYTMSRLANDGVAVAEWASRQLEDRKLALVAFSGGTIVALHLIRKRPELFSAYVGSGQFVHWGQQDALSYARVLAQARATRDAKAIAELERIGAPPYPDTATDAIKAKYSVALTPAEAAAFVSLPEAVAADIRKPPADAIYVPQRARPYTDGRAVATAAYDAIRDEILAFDAERLGLDFPLPMIFLQGELDACTVSSVVEEYAARIRAPHKAYVSIPGAGHSPWIMREQYLSALQVRVIPALRF